MSDTEFDTALVTAAFRLAGEDGWRKVNVALAARAAGLSLAEARGRFASRASILLRFGRLADQAALLDAPDDGPVRDRLFDMLMRRIDVLQAHRSGVTALLRSLPTDPATALLLACASRRSMRWMLQGAGVTATGPRGELQVKGLLAVWLWAVRAWERDESTDLSGTMAAIDTALERAEKLAAWWHVRPSAPPPPVAPASGELDSANPPSDVFPPSGDLSSSGFPTMGGSLPAGLPSSGDPPLSMGESASAGASLPSNPPPSASPSPPGARAAGELDPANPPSSANPPLPATPPAANPPSPADPPSPAKPPPVNPLPPGSGR